MTYKLFVIVFLLTTSSITLAKEENIKAGMSRCDLGMQTGYFAPIRGTGYYWLEYISSGLNKHNQLAILIKSNVPAFIDRQEIKNRDLTCEQQVIMDYIYIDEDLSLVDSFDCHILDDMPNPIGEITFGKLSNQSSPGLYKPFKSWRAIISQEGKVGKIEAVVPEVRVLCTLLPGIDE